MLRNLFDERHGRTRVLKLKLAGLIVEVWESKILVGKCEFVVFEIEMDAEKMSLGRYLRLLRRRDLPRRVSRVG